MKVLFLAPVLFAGCYAGTYGYGHQTLNRDVEHHAIEQHAAYDHATYGHPPAPPPIVEDHPPYAGFTWVPGGWEWIGAEWQWQSGHYRSH